MACVGRAPYNPTVPNQEGLLIVATATGRQRGTGVRNYAIMPEILDVPPSALPAYAAAKAAAATVLTVCHGPASTLAAAGWPLF